ncbi:MAG: hypothetical protein ACLFQH_08510 [Halothiobacillaceae bacterium]
MLPGLLVACPEKHGVCAPFSGISGVMIESPPVVFPDLVATNPSVNSSQCSNESLPD